ncbi:MAG TPA: acyltransferase [Verrucomicrobiae bacterium]|nr:acyltransferase [Verrucomicrobiae bacterium]
MSNTESARNKLEGLQVLRGVAALLVLWCHLKYYLGRDWHSFSNVPFLGTDLGAIGVDIFFVISGFVISMTAAKAGIDWRTFLASRVARIVPLYFTISTLAGLEFISGYPGGQVSGTAIFDTYAFIPMLEGLNFTGPILVNGWTLSFEMWFYLCFAGLLKLGSVRRAWLLLLFFFLAGMAANLAFNQWAWYLPKFLFHPMTLEFCAGCILYHTRNRIGNAPLYIMGGLSLLFLYLACDSSYLGRHLVIMNYEDAAWHRTIVWGGFATCLVGVMSQIDLRCSWKWPRFLLLLGDASYSIYLVPILFVTTFEMGIDLLSKIAGHDLTPPPLWYGSIYILGSVAAGIACWKFFELPSTSLARRFLSRFLPDKLEKQSALAGQPTNETLAMGN